MKIKIVKISNIQGSAKKFLGCAKKLFKKIFGQILEVDWAKNFSVVPYICQNWGEKLLIANVSQLNSVYQVPGSVKHKIFFSIKPCNLHLLMLNCYYICSYHLEFILFQINKNFHYFHLYDSVQNISLF